MTRLILVIIFIFILGAALLPFGELPSSGAEQENPFLYLEKAMEVAGARVYEGEMHYWASLKEDSGEASLEEQAQRAGELIGLRSAEISSELFPASAVEPAAQVVELSQELPTGVKARLLLQCLEEQGKEGRHLVVTLSQEEKTDDLAAYAFKMPAVFAPQAKESNVSFCLAGHLDEELSLEQMEALASRIHQELDAKIIHGFKEGPLVSVTGYSPLLGDYFQVEGERFNLNVALRYDDYQGKTVIWVGTPLIARSY